MRRWHIWFSMWCRHENECSIGRVNCCFFFGFRLPFGDAKSRVNRPPKLYPPKSWANKEKKKPRIEKKGGYCCCFWWWERIYQWRRGLYICGYKVDCILLGMIRKWFLCSFEHELAILHLITIRSTLRILLRLLAIAMAFTLESTKVSAFPNLT